MARNEKIHNNGRLHEELKNQSFHTLSAEARAALRETIQNSKSLGQYKRSEQAIYYVVKECLEISKATTEHYLNLYRFNRNEKSVTGESSIEKYKKAAMDVAVVFEELLNNGIELKGMVKHKKGRVMTDEEEAMYLQMAQDKMTVQERIEYLRTLL